MVQAGIGGRQRECLGCEHVMGGLLALVRRLGHPPMIANLGRPGQPLRQPVTA
jgi:hypothetical protein